METNAGFKLNYSAIQTAKRQLDIQEQERKSDEVLSELGIEGLSIRQPLFTVGVLTASKQIRPPISVQSQSKKYFCTECKHRSLVDKKVAMVICPFCQTEMQEVEI